MNNVGFDLSGFDGLLFPSPNNFKQLNAKAKKHPYICGGVLPLNLLTLVTLVDSPGWLPKL